MTHKFTSKNLKHWWPLVGGGWVEWPFCLVQPAADACTDVIDRERDRERERERERETERERF